MVIMMAVGTTPTRQIIRDAVAGQIVPDGTDIITIGEYVLKVTKRPTPTQCKFIQVSDLRNHPAYLLHFDEDEVVIRIERATGMRVIARIDYSDPMMLTKLAAELAEFCIDVRL